MYRFCGMGSWDEGYGNCVLWVKNNCIYIYIYFNVFVMIEFYLLGN